MTHAIKVENFLVIGMGDNLRAHHTRGHSEPGDSGE